VVTANIFLQLKLTRIELGFYLSFICAYTQLVQYYRGNSQKLHTLYQDQPLPTVDDWPNPTYLPRVAYLVIVISPYTTLDWFSVV
jgi:hypothetical protein